MNKIKDIAKGIGISLIITITLLLIYALILTYTNISESSINIVTTIISGISILIGSFLGNKKIEKNGLINGAIVGGGYMIIIYLISSIINCNFSLKLESIIMILVGCICGILGGIIGVNSKRK